MAITGRASPPSADTRPLPTPSRSANAPSSRLQAQARPPPQGPRPSAPANPSLTPSSPDRQGRRRQHRPRPGHPAALRVPRQRPHRHRLHPGPVRGGTGAAPPRSVYGHARVITPLLDQPLTRRRSTCAPPPTSSPTWSPTLDGQIKVELAGRLDSVKGAIRNTFEVRPRHAVDEARPADEGRQGGYWSTRTSAEPQKALAHFVAPERQGHDATPLIFPR